MYLLVGQDVVSANKNLIGENFEKIQRILEKTDARLLYEAAVADSIPILQTINGYNSNLSVSKVAGILNGSSNYILTQIEQKGWTYEQALTKAQEPGFAESDPSLDVGGFDARYKLLILTYHAFGQFIPPKEIAIKGIDELTKEDFEQVSKNGSVIKPLAVCELLPNGKISAWVAPIPLDSSSPLARLDNELNGIAVDTFFAGQQLFSGKGAGSLPTGSAAVYNDVLLLRKGFNYAVPEPANHFLRQAV